MAVTSIEQLWTGRRASDDIKKQTKFTHVYEVITDDINDDGSVVGGNASLPRLGDSHPNYPDAYVSGVIAEQMDESPFHWRVTIEYDTELANEGGAAAQLGGADGPGAEATGIDDQGEPTTATTPEVRPLDPRDRPPVWTIDSVEEEEPFIIDADGDPILNSALMPYDPPLMTVRRRMIVQLNKAIDPIGFGDIEDYIDHVNAEDWRGLAAGTVKVETFRTQSAKENGISYQEAFLQFKVKSEGWRRKVIDRGMKELFDTTGTGDYEWFQITDPKTGIPFNDPQLLDGEGAKLAAGLEAVIYPTDGYIEFQTADFAALETLLGLS